MRLDELTLENFRNIDRAQLRPGPGLNLFVGPNAQGKTSLLEAVGWVATLRSFRGAKSRDLVREGQAESNVGAAVSSEDQWRSRLEVSLSSGVAGPPENLAALSERTFKKRAFIDQKLIPSAMDYLTHHRSQYGFGFHAISFNPSDHELIRGEPKGRRAYFDHFISSVDETYFRTLRRYEKVLTQRNALLKAQAMGEMAAEGLYRDLTAQLAQLAASIVQTRAGWTRKVSKRVAEIGREIAPRQGDLEAVYEASGVEKETIKTICYSGFLDDRFSGQSNASPLQDLEKDFLVSFEKISRREQAAQTTLIGPHRDDWTLKTGERALRFFGSQGEMRTALLSLKLAEMDLFRASTGSKPVFLLDDFSSELDYTRRKQLLGYLTAANVQTLITSTESFDIEGEKFQVKDGVVLPGRF